MVKLSWLDVCRIAIGAVALVGVIVLAYSIAHGQVEEKTSFGLSALFTIVGKVILDFSEWLYKRFGPSDTAPNNSSGVSVDR